MNQSERAEDKQSKQELLAIFSRQEAILAAVPGVIIMKMDNHKIYTWANQAGLAFFGDDVIGKEAVFYFVGEQTASEVVPSPLDGHQDLIRVRSWQRRRDGEKRLLAWQGLVLKDESGNVTGVLSSARDITERKRVEDLLRMKERLLSESQRLGHIGSFLFEMSGSIIQWSEELYRLYGVSPDTFTPTVESFLGLIHPDDQPAMQVWIDACAAGEKPDALEFRINKPDGTMRYVRGWGDVVLDVENRPIYMAGTVQDITERKRADEEIRQYTAELAKRNKELQDALADIRQLTGMLPICASCKKIKDDKGYWQGVESYISEHSEAVFSHGLCPECEGKMYEDLGKLKNEKHIQ
jgi:PAS domain S-box-containing protein